MREKTRPTPLGVDEGLAQYKHSEVEGKVVHLLSGKTTHILGSDMTQKGARAFFC